MLDAVLLIFGNIKLDTEEYNKIPLNALSTTLYCTVMWRSQLAATTTTNLATYSHQHETKFNKSNMITFYTTYCTSANLSSLLGNHCCCHNSRGKYPFSCNLVFVNFFRPLFQEQENPETRRREAFYKLFEIQGGRVFHV